MFEVKGKGVRVWMNRGETHDAALNLLAKIDASVESEEDRVEIRNLFNDFMVRYTREVDECDRSLQWELGYQAGADAAEGRDTSSFTQH